MTAARLVFPSSSFRKRSLRRQRVPQPVVLPSVPRADRPVLPGISTGREDVSGEPVLPLPLRISFPNS